MSKFWRRGPALFGNATPVPTEDQLLHGVEDGGRDLEERGVNDRLALAKLTHALDPRRQRHGVTA